MAADGSFAEALQFAVSGGDKDLAVGGGDTVPDGRGGEVKAGGLLTGLGVDGPHFGSATAFESFVLLVEFIQNGGVFGREAFEGVFLVDGIRWSTDEDGVAG